MKAGYPRCGRRMGQVSLHADEPALQRFGLLSLLAAMLLPAITGNGNTSPQGQRLFCVNNLRQTGLAFHNFATRHQDRFPMQVSTNDGGSLEYVQSCQYHGRRVLTSPIGISAAVQ